MNKISVVGIGNLLMQDDGVGVHAVNRLSEMDLPEGVNLIDGGTHSYDLIEFFCESNIIIIIDAMQAGGKPGTIYRAPLEELGMKTDDTCISLHQLHFVDAMHMVNLLGHHPRAIVFGVEPASIQYSLELSPEIAAKLPRLVELVHKEIIELIA